MDFNNEATMGKKPTELVSSIIIEKIYNFLEADEFWSQKVMQGGGASYAIARARLRTLYNSSRNILQRNMTPKEYEKLTEVCMNTSVSMQPNEPLLCYEKMFSVFDKVGLWKIDTKAVYNRERVEEANKVHGN